MKRLNIGAGKRILKGYDNLDIHKRFGANIIADLTKLPTKIKSNCYDEVLAENILEHMHDTLKVMDEFVRILKKEGVLIIQVPYSDNAWDSMDHTREFLITTFLDYVEQFDLGTPKKLDFLSAKFVTRQTSSWVRLKVSIYNLLIKIHLKIIDYTFLRFFSKGLSIRVKFKKIKK